ncbi:MAG TPA: hypothetical protein PLT66_02870 [Bacillota bacterium]|nr:hypothetical protein [Bacillota bacterium]
MDNGFYYLPEFPETLDVTDYTCEMLVDGRMLAKIAIGGDGDYDERHGKYGYFMFLCEDDEWTLDYVY